MPIRQLFQGQGRRVSRRLASDRAIAYGPGQRASGSVSMDRRAGWIAALAGALTLAAAPALASPTKIPLPRSPSRLPPAPTSRSITSGNGAPLGPEARAAIRALDEVSLALRTGQTGDAAARLRLILASPGYI